MSVCTQAVLKHHHLVRVGGTRRAISFNQTLWGGGGHVLFKYFFARTDRIQKSQLHGSENNDTIKKSELYYSSFAKKSQFCDQQLIYAYYNPWFYFQICGIFFTGHWQQCGARSVAHTPMSTTITTGWWALLPGPWKNPPPNPQKNSNID